MTPEDTKSHILKLLGDELVCVISTVTSEGLSESAAMAFTAFEDFSIAFQTPDNTRKYQNLKSNPSVSIVVGWDVLTMISVQYEGFAQEVTDAEEINRIRKAQLEKNSHSERYAHIPENKYFLVKPLWVRYSELQEGSEYIYEFNPLSNSK